jgi:rRNA-processing protein FCF1
MALLTTILIIILLAEVSYLTYRTVRTSERTTGGSPVFIDTSALMDGRIVTAAQTGFLSSPVVIPNSVINELQLLADQGDAEKRSRARRGLDAIKELQDIDWLEVRIMQDGATGNGGVDTRLIELATKHHGVICTIDFNLNKVASVQGIRVLNINELAGSIRMAFLPGETISLPLTQKGQNTTQAVGYLADGTMVVVEKAAGQIGKTVEIEFIRSLQTAAGRMMFARLVSDRPTAKSQGQGRKPTKLQQDNVSDIAAATMTDTDTKPVAVSAPKEKRTNVQASQRPQRTKNNEISTPAPKNTQRSGNRSNNRRRSGEDSLIELVNKQD